MIYTFILDRCADLPTAKCCETMKVSTSAFYAWKKRPCSDRDRDDAYLTNDIIDVHKASRGIYGSPRVHAELRLGEHDCRVARKRVERLMRQAGRQGVYVRRHRGCTVRDPKASPHPDLLNRDFTATGPDQKWVMDVTEHPTLTGKVYLAVVLDVWSRLVIGWSIASHMRAELVVDALQMAIWRRQPGGATIAHSDHGAQYTSWAFGKRIRAAGLLGSMGSIGDCFDNSMAESFFSSLQVELLDRHAWHTREELANAIFEYVEVFYNRTRRHSALGMLSPLDYEANATLTIEEAA